MKKTERKVLNASFIINAKSKTSILKQKISTTESNKKLLRIS